ncbi:MAG TPA: PAS domain S-box protein [Leptolyngbyaceae cyanobacterium]
MFKKIISYLPSYAVAILNVAIALVLTWLLNFQINMRFSPFLLFFGAVIASAWYGSLGPGLLATALSGIAGAYFFIPPTDSLRMTWGEALRLGIFELQGILISAIIAALHSSKKRIEANLLKLKISEEKYRRIIDTAYEGIWLINAEGKIDYANQRIAEMFGYNITDMLDRSIFEFMDKEARLEAQQRIEQSKHLSKQQFDFRYRRRDGSNLWAIVCTSPIIDEQGEFIGSIAMLTDVTERKQAEEALKDSEKRFRSVVESHMIGIGFWDLDGNITYANQVLLQMLGYTRQEFFTQKIQWSEITPPEYSPLDENAIAQIKATGFCTPFEKEYIRRDGSRFPALVGGASLDGCNNEGPFFVLDISERKLAEENTRQLANQVREKANTLNAILSASIDHIYVIDSVGKYKYVSYGAAKVLGFEPTDIINKSWQELGLSSDTMEKFDRQIKEVLSTREPLKTETQYVTASHNLRHYEYTIVPLLYGEEQSVRGVVVISRDITERKQAEMALQESEKRFRRLVESNIFGVAFGDFQGRIHYANDYFLNMVGYERADLIAGRMRWDKMTPAEFLPLDMQAGEEIKKYGISTPFEKEYIRQDGSRVPILIGGALLQEPYEEQEEIIAFYLDLTEIKQTQEALAESNQTLQTLIRACPLGIALFNLDDGTVKMWNPAAEQIFGWSEQEILGHFLPSTSEAKKAEFLANLDMIRQGKSLFAFETKRQKKDGTPIDLSIWACPVRDAKGNISCMSIVADISDRKRLEEERDRLLCREQTARAQAEAANRMKDEFLATLSHELRTPLNAMLGWTQLLHTRQLNEDTTARALETIHRNTKSLAQLIDDVLDVSRIITGKMRLNLSPVPLVPVIEAAIETIASAAEAKKIQIERRLNRSIKSVLGDPTRLQQIIWNLLSNAIKFTPNGGQVTIQLSVQQSEKAIENSPHPLQYAQIKISDTGIGIDPNFLPYVFDRFSQADSTMTRTHGGLGLGLAIVRHLVEMQGGTVLAESAGISKGATFIVNLPLLETTTNSQTDSPTQPPATSEKSSDSNPLNGLRVLVVDDEPDARELLATILRQSGAEVTTVSSAREALEAILKIQPNILLSDIGMPEEDGYTLIRKVRNLDATQGGQIPAVALTAYARAEDRTQALLSGFQLHIPKPINPGELVAAVANLTGRI